MIVNIFSTVIGGSLLALILFLLKEKVFSLPNLNGNWIFETITNKSDYNSYNNMKLRYYVLLWQEGNQIKGTGEKIFEKTETQEIEYVGKNRARVVISGFLTKKYFSTDSIVIHFNEENEQRKSSTIHNLTIKNTNEMMGNFVSTIANTQGTVSWIKRTSS